MLLRIIISSLSTQAICYCHCPCIDPGLTVCSQADFPIFPTGTEILWRRSHAARGLRGTLPWETGMDPACVTLSKKEKRRRGVLKLNIWSHTSPGCLLGKKLLRPKRGSDKKHQTINAVTPCVRPHHKTRSRWDHAEITEEVPCYCLPVCFLWVCNYSKL